jgi:hypothetical protein
VAAGPHAKAGEPDMAVDVDEYVFGLDIFMDQTALMDMAERRCHVNGKAQKTGQTKMLLLVPLKNANRCSAVAAIARRADGSLRRRAR